MDGRETRCASALRLALAGWLAVVSLGCRAGDEPALEAPMGVGTGTGTATGTGGTALPDAGTPPPDAPASGTGPGAGTPDAGPASDGGEAGPFTVTTSSPLVRLSAARPLGVRVNVTRQQGFAGEIEVTIRNLPPGVTAAPLTIGPRETFGSLTLTAEPGRPPARSNAQLEARGGGVVRHAPLEVVLAGLPGAADVRFGAEGVVTTRLGPGEAAAGAVTARPDGRVVAVGHGGDGVAVVQYEFEGGLDRAFATDGVHRLALPGARLNAVALADDGHLIAVGKAPGGGDDLLVLRLGEDGRPDPGFGPDGRGYAVFDFGHDEEAVGVVVRADGKLFLAGHTSEGGGQLLLARVNPNGMLDASYYGTGMTRIRVGAGARASRVQAMRDGRLVIVGAAGAPRNAVAVRLLADGEPDPSFGTNGIATVAISDGDDVVHGGGLDRANRVMLAIASGGATPATFVVRLTTEGRPDPEFGIEGRATWPIAMAHAPTAGLVWTPEGRILVAGAATANGVAQQYVLRVNEAGNLDPTFGTNGLVLTRLSAEGASTHSLAVTANGLILLGGSVVRDGVPDLAVVRLWP
jgi:uncharacterized delta-60 repeat protein